MSAKTLTIRLEDKPALAKRLEHLLKVTKSKTYQGCIEIVIEDFTNQEKTIEQLRLKVLQLQDELELKNGILNDVKRFIAIPARLAELEKPVVKKKPVKGVLSLLD